MKKRLFFSISTILICIMVIVGVTYAVLHDDKNIPGDIVVGNVDVDVNLYYIKDEVEYSKDNISIKDINPGETYTYKVELINNSTYDIQYRNIFNITGDTILLDILDVNVSNVLEEYSLIDFKYNRGISNWDDNLSAKETYTYYLEFKLNESISNEYANKEIYFNLLIEAIENRFTIINSQDDLNKLVDKEYAILGCDLNNLEINKNIYLDLNNKTVNNLSIKTNNDITVELLNGTINNLDVESPNSSVYCYAYTKVSSINTNTNSFYYFNDNNELSTIKLVGGKLVLDTNNEIVLLVDSIEEETKELEIYVSKNTTISKLTITSTVTKKVVVINNGTINDLEISDDVQLEVTGNDINVEVSTKTAIVSNEDIQLYINEDNEVKKVSITTFKEALLGTYTTIYLTGSNYEVNEIYTITKDLTLISKEETTLEINETLNFNDNNVYLENINFIANKDTIIATSNTTLNIKDCSFDQAEVAIYLDTTNLNLENVEFKQFVYPILVSNLETSIVTENNTTYKTELSVVYKENTKAIVVNELREVLEEVNDKVVLRTNLYITFESALENNDTVYLLDDTTLSNYKVVNKIIYANNYTIEINNVEINNVVIDNANITNDELKVYGVVTITNTTFNNEIALNIYESNDVYLKNNTYTDSYVKVNADVCSVYVTGDNENVYYYSSKLNVISVNETNLIKEEIELVNDKEVTKTYVFEYTYTSLQDISFLTGDVYILEGTYILDNTLVLNNELNIISYGIIIENSDNFNDSILLEVNNNLTITDTEFIVSSNVVGLLLENKNYVVDTTNSTFTNFEKEVLIVIEDELNIVYNGLGIVVYEYTNKVVLGNSLDSYIEIENNVYYKVNYTNINEVINDDATIYVTGSFNFDNVTITNNLEFIGYDALFTSNTTLFNIENCNVVFNNITFDSINTVITYKGSSDNYLSTPNCVFKNNNIIKVNVDLEEAVVNTDANIIYYSSNKTVVSKNKDSYIEIIDNKTYEYIATDVDFTNVLDCSEVYIVSETYLFKERLLLNNDIKFIAQIGTIFKKEIADFKGHIFFIIYNCDVEFNNIEFIDHIDSNVNSKGIITKSVDGVDASNIIINNCIFNEFKSNALTINGESLYVYNSTFKLSEIPGTNFSAIQIGGVCNAVIENSSFIGKTNDLLNSNTGILMYKECIVSITNNTFDTLTSAITINYLSGEVTYNFEGNTITNNTTDLVEVKNGLTYVGKDSYYEVILEDKIVYYTVTYSTIEEALLNSSDVYVLEGTYVLNSNVLLDGKLIGIGKVIINTNFYKFEILNGSIVTNIEIVGGSTDV